MSKKNKDQQFQALYKRYFSDVVHWLRRRHLESDEAQDLAQDIFARVYNGLDDFRGEHPWPWILMIAKRVRMNWLRGKKTKKRDHLEATVETIPEPSMNIEAPWILQNVSPEEQASRNEDIARLNAIIGGMPKRRKRVLLLRFRDGAKIREIARLLNISQDTVKTDIRKVRQEMRSSLPDVFPKEPTDE